MSGLDKIIARISEEAEAKAGAIISEAEKKAAGITSEGAAKTAEECERIAKKADAVARNTQERGKASAELRTKQIMLGGKQELMNEVIAEARNRLDNLSDDEYAAFIEKLFRKHVPSEDAVLKLNERDLKRLPKETIDRMTAEAKAHGAVLKVSDKPADITDGFVLDFGGVEENCTTDALIEQNTDDLLDKIKDILF